MCSRVTGLTGNWPHGTITGRGWRSRGRPGWVDGRPAVSADRNDPRRAVPVPLRPPSTATSSLRCCVFAGSGRNVVPLLSLGQQLRDDVVAEIGGLPQRRDDVAAARRADHLTCALPRAENARSGQRTGLGRGPDVAATGSAAGAGPELELRRDCHVGAARREPDRAGQGVGPAGRERAAV